MVLPMKFRSAMKLSCMVLVQSDADCRGVILEIVSSET
jgi:hypothetical protein